MPFEVKLPDIGEGVAEGEIVRWLVKVGDAVSGGDILGTVPETKVIEHRVLVPPRVSGTIASIISAGEYTVDTVVAELTDGTKIKMFHSWPVKVPRPVTKMKCSIPAARASSTTC